MSQTRKIECLERLNKMTGGVDELFAFLKEEKLIDVETAKKIQQSSDRAKNLQIFLSELSKTDKIQMLEYEWQILPVERIKITMVTHRNSREFTYNI